MMELYLKETALSIAKTSKRKNRTILRIMPVVALPVFILNRCLPPKLSLRLFQLEDSIIRNF
jgi:hypothetical protein